MMIWWLILLWYDSSYALILDDTRTNLPRRIFLQEATHNIGSSLLVSSSQTLPRNEGNDDPFQAKGITWNAGDYRDLRYGSSSIQEKLPSHIARTLTEFPSWMKGYWLCRYTFEKVSFPLGRNKMSIRVPGAGLGTCWALPNVGYSPAPFVQRFRECNTTKTSNDGSTSCFEDIAYNVPRKFEAFWPQAKVVSIQTSIGEESNAKNVLSPICSVTGEGCTSAENPNLHSLAATRFRMEFQGPTKGGSRRQTIDSCMIAPLAELGCDSSESSFLATRSFVQYNVEQELVGNFQEILSMSKAKEDLVRGRVRLAAFLPQYESTADIAYDDSQAIAIYDTNFILEGIDSIEASSL